MARNKYPEETVQLILNTALRLFMENGYDNTSIQDIVNNLGGLSKGAIYHHFKSKDEIFEAATEMLGEQNAEFYANIRDDASKNGLQKLRAMLCGAYENPNNEVLLRFKDKIAGDPKFLSQQLEEAFGLVAPVYLQPVIEEGVRDGSIRTNDPKELAEVIILLVNIWMNPIWRSMTAKEMRRKLDFIGVLLGKDVDLLDDEMKTRIVEYFGSLFQPES